MRAELRYWRDTVRWFMFSRQPARRWMVRLTRRWQRPERCHVWLLDQLYADDAMVTFPAEETR